jgi:hypothetical protein
VPKHHAMKITSMSAEAKLQELSTSSPDWRSVINFTL